MSLEFVNPTNSPAPAGGYSNLAVIPPDRRLLVIAGQIGNLIDGSIVEGLEAQFDQALANINSIVSSQGGDSSDVARVTVFLVEKPTKGKLIGEALSKNFPGADPAMSWIYVAGLFRPDVLVEIEAIAAVK